MLDPKTVESRCDEACDCWINHFVSFRNGSWGLDDVVSQRNAQRSKCEPAGWGSDDDGHSDFHLRFPFCYFDFLYLGIFRDGKQKDQRLLRLKMCKGQVASMHHELHGLPGTILGYVGIFHLQQTTRWLSSFGGKRLSPSASDVEAFDALDRV